MGLPERLLTSLNKRIGELFPLDDFPILTKLSGS